jgi:hypothetical protein
VLLGTKSYAPVPYGLFYGSSGVLHFFSLGHCNGGVAIIEAPTLCAYCLSFWFIYWPLIDGSSNHDRLVHLLKSNKLPSFHVSLFSWSGCKCKNCLWLLFLVHFCSVQVAERNLKAALAPCRAAHPRTGISFFLLWDALARVVDGMIRDDMYSRMWYTRFIVRWLAVKIMSGLSCITRDVGLQQQSDDYANAVRKGDLI